MGTVFAVPFFLMSYGTLRIQTSRRTQLLDVTGEVRHLLQKMRASAGVCHLYVPHTTAGITINENADPDVVRDMEMALDRLVPRDAGYRHAEGNSDSHIKTTLVGKSASVLIEAGELVLGRWQGIFFCEFDGPRRREIYVKYLADTVSPSLR